MSAFAIWRGSVIKLPETTAEVEALVAEAEQDLREKAARTACTLCAMGHAPRKGKLGWTHGGVPGYTDDRGCDAAKIRDLS